MKKFFKYLFSFLLVVPFALVLTACGGNGDDPGNGNGDNSNGGEQSSQTYVIKFYEQIFWDGDEPLQPMYTMTVNKGDKVTFPTDDCFYESGKLIYYNDTFTVERWDIKQSWGNLDIDESYFDYYNGGDIELFATWTKKALPIAYNLNGGTNHPNNPTEADGLHHIQNPTRPGYKFLGWTYTDNNYNNPLDEPTMYPYQELYHGATLTAHWEQNTINFLGNSETSGSMDPIHFVAGEAIELPDCGFTKTGSELIGWCQNRYGIGEIYTENFLFAEDMGEMSVYAVWETGLDIVEDSTTFDYDLQMTIPTSYVVRGVKEGYPNAFIPEEINGCPIVEVRMGDDIVETLTFENDGLLQNGRVFRRFEVLNCANLVSMQMPKCITRLEACSNNPKLKEIILHDNLKYVSMYENGLEELILPVGVEYVNIAEMSQLTKLVLPSTVEDYFIFDMPVLQDLTIPFAASKELSTEELKDRVWNYGENYVCEPIGLKKLTISGDGEIGFEKTFEGYSSIEEIIITGQAEIPTQLFYGIPDVKKITLNDSIIEIGIQAFAECPKLEEVITGNGVEIIRSEAFLNCVNLTKVNSATNGANLPSSLTLLTEGMFKGCEKLSSIDYAVNQNTGIPNYFAYNCKSLTTFTFKDGIENVGSYAFDGSGLTELVGEENIINIQEYSFARTNLTSISLDSWQAEYLHTGAFYDCKLLSTVSINPEVKSISFKAFENCSSLTDLSAFTNIEHIYDDVFRGIGITTLELWPSLKTVENMAFADCTNLQTVDLTKATQVRTLVRTFYNCTKLKYIYLPAHITALKWEVFFNTGIELIEVEDGFNATLTGKVFSNMSYLKKVDFKESTIRVAGAFENCPILEEIIGGAVSGFAALFGATSEYLAKYPNAFEQIAQNKDGTNLIWVPKSLKKLKLYNSAMGIFAHSGIEHIEITAETICENAFKGSSKLKTVIANNLTTIEASAFENCPNLESLVTASPVINQVGASAFKNCTKLGSIDLSKATIVKERAFENCTSLKSVNLSSIKTLEKYAFYNNTDLSGLVLNTDSAFKIIPEYAFTNHKLKSIYIANNITEINQYAFAGGSELASVTFADDAKAMLYESIFSGATKLESIYIPSTIGGYRACLKGITNLKYASFKLHGWSGETPVWDRVFGEIPQALETLELRDGSSDYRIADNQYIKHLRFINYSLIGTYMSPTGTSRVSFTKIFNLPNLEDIYIEGTVNYLSEAILTGLDKLSTVILGDFAAYHCYTTDRAHQYLIPLIEEVKVVKSVVENAIEGGKENAYLTITDNPNYTVTSDDEYYYFTKNEVA